MFRENLTSEDVLNNMLELANYLAKQEGDMNIINATVDRNGKSLHMHFKAYTEDVGEE